jgi:hypothetical protein
MTTALFHSSRSPHGYSFVPSIPAVLMIRSRGPHGYNLVLFLPAALMDRALFRLFPRSSFLQYGQSVLMATALFRLLSLLFFSSFLPAIIP